MGDAGRSDILRKSVPQALGVAIPAYGSMELKGFLGEAMSAGC